MPKSLLVFVVSFTPETPNFWDVRWSRAPPLRIFLKLLLFNCVYAHISILKYKNILILKKNRIQTFQGAEPLKEIIVVFKVFFVVKLVAELP